jgi:hypothetical protein
MDNPPSTTVQPTLPTRPRAPGLLPRLSRLARGPVGRDSIRGARSRRCEPSYEGPVPRVSPAERRGASPRIIVSCAPHVGALVTGEPSRRAIENPPTDWP